MPKRKGLVLKVTLDHTKPPIWRRIVVTDDLTLDELHLIIQEAMGWYDAHLHCFVANGREFAPVDEDYGFESDAEDETKVRVTSLLKLKGAKMKYTYDFGDGWDHTIVYEGDAPGPVVIPRVLKGRRACPPEDIGGPYEFARIMDIVSGKLPPEEGALEKLEWLGKFTPDEFDVAKANERLKLLLS